MRPSAKRKALPSLLTSLKKLRLQRTVARKFSCSRKLFANAMKRSAGRRALPISAIEKIQDFYQVNSNPLPDKKYVSKKTLEARHIMQCTIGNLYVKYTEAYPDKPVSSAIFYRYRPRQLKMEAINRMKPGTYKDVYIARCARNLQGGHTTARNALDDHRPECLGRPPPGMPWTTTTRNALDDHHPECLGRPPPGMPWTTTARTALDDHRPECLGRPPPGMPWTTTARNALDDHRPECLGRPPPGLPWTTTARNALDDHRPDCLGRPPPGMPWTTTARNALDDHRPECLGRPPPGMPWTTTSRNALDDHRPECLGRTCDGVEYTYVMSSWPLFLIIQVAPEDRTLKCMAGSRQMKRILLRKCYSMHRRTA